MQELPQYLPYPIFTPNLLTNMRKKYNLHNPGDMDKAIDILDEWLRKQEHLTMKEFPRDYLERAIINIKGSIERSKLAIDKLCTMRTLLPRFFEKNNAAVDFDVLKDVILQLPLPKLTKNNERVFVIQVRASKLSPNIVSSGFQFTTLCLDFYKCIDYSDSLILIADFRKVEFVATMRAVNFIEANHLAAITMHGFCIRIKGIHIITESRTVHLLMALLKQVLSEKLAGRTHVHKNLEELYEYVPQEVFPCDLGGTDKSLQELHNEWVNFISSEKLLKTIHELRSARTDESLRKTDKFNEQYMGMAGTFRTFTVD